MNAVWVAGRRATYQVAPEGLTERRGGEICQSQLSLPDLHIWVLAEDGDTEVDLWRALGGALDDVLELLLRAPLTDYAEYPRDVYAQTWTSYEAQLCQRFCQIVTGLVLTERPDLPSWLREIVARFPDDGSIPISPLVVVLTRPALLALAARIGARDTAVLRDPPVGDGQNIFATPVHEPPEADKRWQDDWEDPDDDDY